MILVDDQSGSKDLFPYIHSINPSSILTRLDPPFGDITWIGNGPDDSGLRIGIEYKKLPDVLDCIIDGRFSGHQLPGLLNTYRRIYLLVEITRNYRWDRRTGVLQKFKPDNKGGGNWWEVSRNGRGFTYRDLEHWFGTLEEFCQVRVVKTGDEYESARWVTSKYSWWTGKGYDEHDALKQFHIPPPPTVSLSKPGIVRRIAKELHDIGWERSKPVADYFGTVYRMITAGVEEWSQIKVGENRLGHQLTIGKNRAAKIVNEINGKGAFE